jgi:protein-S-isoprenylcysteine O-methyltransferase Ste14
MLGRVTAFLYGVFCYVAFLASFLYAVGFLGNFGVPKSIDSGPQMPLGYALAINLALLGLFALQHSVMARPWFKSVWACVVPPVVERSTYVLFSSLALLLLFWKWEPMGGVVWSVDNLYGRGVITALYAMGWLVVLIATFQINQFDLFGLRQVWFYLKGEPYQPESAPSSSFCLVPSPGFKCMMRFLNPGFICSNSSSFKQVRDFSAARQLVSRNDGG